MADYFILSSRYLYPIPAQCVVIEFEEVLIDCFNAKLIAPRKNHKLEGFLVDNKTTLIICGLTLHMIVESMQQLGKYINKFENIVVYIFDAFLGKNLSYKAEWKKKFSKFYRVLGKIDYIFIPFSESINEFQDRLFIKTFHLPMASDTYRFGSRNVDRPIDINGYGRQHKKHSDMFSNYFNKNNNGIYFHTDHFSISKITDFEIHRDYFWNLLRRSKIALAYDPVQVDPNKRFPFSFVGQRWYESLSAGCVVLGSRPTSSDANELLSWTDSTIEIPDDSTEALIFVKELLLDEDNLKKIGLRNSLESIKKNDWRYRVRDMISMLGIPQPEPLKNELIKMKSYLNETK